MSDSEDELFDLLAPDGFPKYFMKKPSGGDPFNYRKPPQRVNMKWRNSEIRKILKAMKILQILKLWKLPKLPKIPNIPKRLKLQESYEKLPENSRNIIRKAAKLFDVWLCRTIFLTFTPTIQITILICTIGKIPDIPSIVCWQKDKWSFSYTRTVIHCLYRSFLLALCVRTFVFFDEILDGPMFYGRPQVIFDAMKSDWIDYFEGFCHKDRITDFFKCLIPNCDKSYF